MGRQAGMTTSQSSGADLVGLCCDLGRHGQVSGVSLTIAGIGVWRACRSMQALESALSKWQTLAADSYTAYMAVMEA